MNDREWLKAKEAERKARLAEQVRKAKKDAGRRGKEPFDFDRLRMLHDLSSELTASTDLRDSQAVAEDLERRYYLDFPQVLTIREFAEKLDALRPYR